MDAVASISLCFYRKCAFCICLKKGGEVDPSRHGVMEVDEVVDCDESSESTGVRSRVTARLVPPTPAAVLCGKASPAGDRGITAATSLRVAMRDIPDSPGHSNAGTPRGFAVSTSPATSVGVNASGSTASPGASVESSPFVSEEDEADDSPSPELGGRAAHDLRWLGEILVVRQGRSRGEQRQLGLNLVALFVEEAVATEDLQEWLSVSVIHDYLTGIDCLYNPLLLDAVSDTEDLTASAMDFAPG